MEPMVKWIGGATAALVLLLGGATLASGLVTGDASEEAAALEETMPAADTVQTEETAQEQDIAATAEPAIQQAAQNTDDTFVIKRILPITGPIKYGEWHWDDEGVPDGPLVMTVDLDARVLSVFRGGYEIGASAVLLGTDEHPTPLGTFPIRYKMRHNVSEKYNNAPMPYSMFLTTDGVAIHGSEVENGYASHGCIGTPDDFAAKIFAIAKKGDKVIITRGKRIGMGDSII